MLPSKASTMGDNTTWNFGNKTTHCSQKPCMLLFGTEPIGFQKANFSDFQLSHLIALYLIFTFNATFI